MEARPKIFWILFPKFNAMKVFPGIFNPTCVAYLFAHGFFRMPYIFLFLVEVADFVLP